MSLLGLAMTPSLWLVAVLALMVVVALAGALFFLLRRRPAPSTLDLTDVVEPAEVRFEDAE